ncbi:helix-turn-helix domain-containing protein [Sphingomonas sp.]|uniref:helix-turn-helix domain-containing protein n=1 Tax=Sphingomonas sp. TaxID=28214 RepID=UPI00389E9ADB
MAKIFCSVLDAASALGVGRSMIYELMNSDHVESVKIGQRRMIVVESLNSYAQSLRKAA